jgi:hypothetical protein
VLDGVSERDEHRVVVRGVERVEPASLVVQPPLLLVRRRRAVADVVDPTGQRVDRTQCIAPLLGEQADAVVEVRRLLPVTLWQYA